MVRHPTDSIEPPAIQMLRDDAAEAHLSPNLGGASGCSPEVRGHAPALPHIEALLLDMLRRPIPTDHHEELWKTLHEAGRFDYARYVTSVTVASPRHSHACRLARGHDDPPARVAAALPLEPGPEIEEADLEVLSASVEGARFVIGAASSSRHVGYVARRLERPVAARGQAPDWRLRVGGRRRRCTCRRAPPVRPATLRLALPRAHAAEAAFFEALGGASSCRYAGCSPTCGAAASVPAPSRTRRMRCGASSTSTRCGRRWMA